VTVRGDLALIVMAGMAVVRRTMWVSPSPSSIAKVVSDTAIVRVRRAWARPRLTRWPQTETVPVVDEAPHPDRLECWPGRRAGRPGDLVSVTGPNDEVLRKAAHGDGTWNHVPDTLALWYDPGGVNGIAELRHFDR
jgi:hypothetical protein